MKRINIEMVSVKSEKTSPARFKEVMRDHSSDIQSVTIAPPRLGESGFGSLLVEYKNPVFRMKKARAKQRVTG